MLTSLVSSAFALALALPGAATAPSVGPGPGPIGVADSVVVEKKARRLTLYHMGRELRSYRIALGGNPTKDKVMRGDRRTPEGLFFIEARNPNSQFHLSLRISYPSARHREVAAKLGVDPGDDIMIHGLPNGRRKVGKAHLMTDWTNGCVALTDEEMEEIWSAVPVGTPIEIKA